MNEDFIVGCQHAEKGTIHPWWKGRRNGRQNMTVEGGLVNREIASTLD
jgi:hypothetical protein